MPITHIKEYYLVEEKWFYDRLTEQRIRYAIQYLQIYALQKYIIPNYKSIFMMNPFYDLFNIKYPIVKNTDAFIQIVKILLNNYEDYMDLISKCPKTDKNKYIYEIIYSILPNDYNNICMICIHTEPLNELISACICKTSTHFGCLVQLIKTKHTKCRMCLTEYRTNDQCWMSKNGIRTQSVLDDRIYFPFDDVYYRPLSNDANLIKVSGITRLDFAIMFLQIERVKELLQDPEILNELPYHYLGYDGYKQTPLIALCSGNIGNNCHIKFGNNLQKYIAIVNMLIATKKIDIWHKDAFNKTCMDYINGSNYKFIKYIF